MLLIYFQFRRTVADITKPEHDDFYLIRWLNGMYKILYSRVKMYYLTENSETNHLNSTLARNWDAAAAEKMLREVFQLFYALFS